MIETKLLRPRVAESILARHALIERLEQGVTRKLTLVSAAAGYGKSTLLSAWLEHNAVLSAWVSLDEHDNDLRLFAAYVVGAIQSAFPNACPATEALLTALELPSPDFLAISLINEISGLPQPFILVLDDYHAIADRRVHEFVKTLLLYQPHHMHLVIATRRNPPFPLVRLRANRQMTEIRLDDLRFDRSETRKFLEICLDGEVANETVAVLAERTEGWVVGLRLACLAMRNREDVPAFLQSFRGTHRYIMEYLMDEVLQRQPRPIQDFLLRTSILDRFCAPLCDAIMEADYANGQGVAAGPPSVDILSELRQANLFVLPLDQTGEWFRYHQLLQELLRHRLHMELDRPGLAALHTAAGNWLAENGSTKEALDHFLAAADMAKATALVTRQRHALMNEAQWQQLEHLLGRFPPDAVDRTADLMMLKTWLAYHRGNWSELPAALLQLDQILPQSGLPPEASAHIRGEMAALRSVLAYFACDPAGAIAAAEQSIRSTPPDLWIVRALARLALAGGRQMTGDLQAAFDIIYGAYAEEEVDSNAFKATVLVTACNIYWIAADLHGLQQAADEGRALSQTGGSRQMLAWTRHYLGCVDYHRNDLQQAEVHFKEIVDHPYFSYGECYAHSACGLALTYQAQGRPHEANEIADAAIRFMLATGNTSLLTVVEALQAELALRQGRFAAARQWASRSKAPPPLEPIVKFFAPPLTLARVWLAEGSAASQARASDLLDWLRTFFETTHNLGCLIEVLALQALLYGGRGEQAAALANLHRALTLAQPGRFIRLFVDLGPAGVPLLVKLRPAHEEHRQYIDEILAAFPSASGRPPAPNGRRSAATAMMGPKLIAPLTDRELDVLALLALGLTDKEIASRLTISPHTVRTHIKHIFAKLEVGNRREAAVRATQLGVLSLG